MQDFKKLAVWQKSHTFTLLFIMNNLEGCGRNGNKELTRFLYIAKGSPKGYRFAYALEVECQILIARDLGYLSKEKSDLLESKINEIARMLTSLIAKTRN